MKVVIVSLALPVILGIAVAQSQLPATSNSKTSDSVGEPSTERIYGPKDGAKAPKRIYSPDPDYPEKARKSRKEGIVALSLVVGSNGLTRDVAVTRSVSPDLDQAAIDAVKKWKFVPGAKDGKPVASRIHVEVQFKLY